MAPKSYMKKLPGFLPYELERLRQERGWTQMQLAQCLGFKSRSQVCRWLAGSAEPRYRELKRIARRMKIAVQELFGDEFVNIHDKALRDHAQLFNQLNPEDKKVLHNFGRTLIQNKISYDRRIKRVK